MDTPKTEGRVAQRQRRNRTALIEAGRKVMSEKGIDAATMQEIADLADVGAGTVYNYFKSKDDLVIAVMEQIMHNLALRIEKVTNTFEDPAQVYAYGIRKVLEAATGDVRWKQLLFHSEVIADAIYRCMGPFAIRDLKNATEAGRFKVDNPELTWKMAAHAIVGISLSITKKEFPPKIIDQSVVNLLCMTGIDKTLAQELAARPCPPIVRK